MTSESSDVLHFFLECRTASEVTRLAVCGNWQGWSLASAVNLTYTEDEGERAVWLPGIHEGAPAVTTAAAAATAARLPATASVGFCLQRYISCLSCLLLSMLLLRLQVTMRAARHGARRSCPSLPAACRCASDLSPMATAPLPTRGRSYGTAAAACLSACLRTGAWNGWACGQVCFVGVHARTATGHAAVGVQQRQSCSTLISCELHKPPELGVRTVAHVSLLPLPLCPMQRDPL